MPTHLPSRPAVRRKRAATRQKLSTRKEKLISLCRHQTSQPPAKKHRANQRADSAQVPEHGAARLSHCARHFARRATIESRATRSRKFRFHWALATQQKNRKFPVAAP